MWPLKLAHVLFFYHILLNALLLAFLDPGWFRALVNRHNVCSTRQIGDSHRLAPLVAGEPK